MAIEDVSDINSKDEKIDTSDERAAFDSIDEKDDDSKDDDDKKDDDEDEEVDENEEEDTKDDDKEADEEEEIEELNNDSIYQTLKAEGIFKKVPELRSILFREQEFSSIYSSIDDAKEALEAAETFKSFQSDITEGNSENLLQALKKVDDKALESFVANFTGTVEKVSKDLYLGMLYPEFKKMIRAAIKSGDERLEISAKNLHWFIFGDTEVNSEVGLSPTKKNEADERVSKREREFESRVLDSFTNDVGSIAEKRLKRVISIPFKDSGVSPLLQAKLTDEIYTRVNKAIAADKRHMGNINHLWEQAKRAGFTTEWKDRIITAFLSRAKVLTPKIRREVLQESKLSVKTSEVTDVKKAKRIPSSGSISSYKGGKVDPKTVDWDKADERAMLDGKIPLRK